MYSEYDAYHDNRGGRSTPHSATLYVDQVQSTIIKDDHPGPFWMDKQGRLDSKFDKEI